MKLLWMFSLCALLVCSCKPKDNNTPPSGANEGSTSVETDSGTEAGTNSEQDQPSSQVISLRETSQRMCEFKDEYMEDVTVLYNNQGQMTVTSTKRKEIPEMINTGGMFSTDFIDQGQKTTAGAIVWTYNYRNYKTNFRRNWCPEGGSLLSPKDCLVEVIYRGDIADNKYTGTLTIEVNFSGQALTFSHCN